MCALESSLLRSLGRLAGCCLLLLLSPTKDFVACRELGVEILLESLGLDESFGGVCGSVGGWEESGSSFHTSV